MGNIQFKRYKCNLCDFSSDNATLRNIHQNDEHLSQGERFKCRNCHQSFYAKYMFNVHKCENFKQQEGYFVL
jgi:hypothetical protein